MEVDSVFVDKGSLDSVLDLSRLVFPTEIVIVGGSACEAGVVVVGSACAAGVAAADLGPLAVGPF